MLQMKPRLTCVDDFLNRAFYQIGITVGRHPGYFIIVPLLLGVICITGFQRIHYEIDPEYLFSPIDGPGKYERAVVEQYFKVNYSHQFSLGRITRPGKWIWFRRIKIHNTGCPLINGPTETYVFLALN